MRSNRFGGAIISWSLVLLGVVVASCGQQEAPVPSVDGGPAGVVILVDLPRDPGEAAAYRADFGFVLVGARAGIRAVIKNAGRDEVYVEGGMLDAPFGTDLPESGRLIAAGDSAAVDLTFHPQAEGAASAVLLLTAQSGGESKEIRIVMAGHGRAPIVDCDPGVLDFGAVLVGEEKELSFRCTNRMDMAISLEFQWAEEGGSFGMELMPSAVGHPFVLPANGAMEARLIFRPTEAGRHVRSLEVREPDGPPLATIGILGSGDEPPTPVCLEFTPPRVALGTCGGTLEQVVAVRSSCGVMTIDTIGIVPGPHDHAFQVTEIPPLPLTLTTGDKVSFGLRITPAEGDPRDLEAELGFWSGSDAFTLPITVRTTREQWENFVIEDPNDPRLRLVASPSDTNGDGVVDELDFVLFADGRLIEPGIGNDEWKWSYDPDDNAIVLQFAVPPEPGDEVTVIFDVPCFPLTERAPVMGDSP